MKKPTLFLFFLSLFLHPQAQSLRELYQQGLKAYEEKNYPLFKEKMFTIDTMRPNYPPVVYNLAGGYALTGEIDSSLEKLKQYILMNATLDFSTDDDFTSLLKEPGFQEIRERQRELTTEIPVSIAYEFPLLATHSECITYSRKQKAFFLGGVRDGQIWKAQENQGPEVWAKSPENSWGIMGITTSADGKTLWACTSAIANFDGLKAADKDKVSVLKYDLKKGTLLETYALPASHTFGDLITDTKGNIYISDGAANQLYWINKKTGKLELFFDLSETIRNLQGLTLNEDETSIYLSDYINGIYKLELATKKLNKLKTSDNVLLKGIDGLYFQRNTLIGLHNGTNPNRVVRYTLDASGSRITKGETLAQSGLLGEPTQGTLLNGTLYFLANSPWGSYDQEGNFDAPEGNLIIGKIE